MGESMAVEFARERLGICTVEKDYLCTSESKKEFSLESFGDIFYASQLRR